MAVRPKPILILEGRISQGEGILGCVLDPGFDVLEATTFSTQGFF